MSAVVVCGGRTFADGEFLRAWLDVYLRRIKFTAITHGGASGADALASEWAAERGLAETVFPADWDTHGKAAGPIRNRAMLATRPLAVIAFRGGAGTANTIKLARKRRIPVYDLSRVISLPIPEPRT